MPMPSPDLSTDRQIEAASSYCSRFFTRAVRDIADSLEIATKKIPPNSFSLSGGTINRKSFLFYKD